MAKLTFKDNPPPVSSKGGAPEYEEYNRIAEELRQHPGQWAVVQTAYSASATRTWQHRGLLAKSRKNADGMYDIWASAPKEK